VGVGHGHAPNTQSSALVINLDKEEMVLELELFIVLLYNFYSHFKTCIVFL